MTTPKYNKAKATGKASLTIKLRDGLITMYHGEAGNILNQWKASNNDWSILFANICDSFPLENKISIEENN